MMIAAAQGGYAEGGRPITAPALRLGDPIVPRHVFLQNDSRLSCLP